MNFPVTPRLARIFLPVLLMIGAMPLPAKAWSAVAASPDQGVSYLYYMAKNAAEAEQEALAGCKRAATDCRLLGEARDGPLATVIVHSPAGVYRASHADPDQALREAMQQCQRHHGACRFVSAAWDRGTHIMAVAIDHENVWVGPSRPTEPQARQDALALCEKASRAPENCALYHVLNGPGWVAVARGHHRTGIGLSVRSADTARQNALAECERDDDKARDSAQENATDTMAGAEPEGPACKDIVVHHNSAGTPEPARYRELVQTIRADKRAQTASVPPFLGRPVR